ncbi:MAG: DUF2851 family protein [Bacteroidota bacterium]
MVAAPGSDTTEPSPLSRVSEPLVAEPAAVLARVPEAAIQDAWVRGLFDASALRTTDGEAVDVLAHGALNRDSGPDVSGTHLRIGRLTWAGDVEIHRTSSEWEAHGHHRDPAYNRVVLHVVLSADRRTGTLRRHDGSPLPELVLLPHLDRSLRSLLRDFYREPREAPHCGSRLGDVPRATLDAWVRSLGIERLRQRAAALGAAYGRRPDLDRLVTGRVFRALGYAPNADAFEELARRLPLAAARRLDGADVHALLVGLAGLLVEYSLFEADGLRTRYEALSAPLGLTSMSRESWRRGGRPANAPRRRLAQAAALLAPGGFLRDEPVARLGDALAQGPEAMLDLLRPEALPGGDRLGAQRAERVLVDAVLPVLLLDGDQREDPATEAAVIDVFGALDAVADRVTRSFAEAGFEGRSALEAQGVHQLARAYCDDGRCARCAVGRTLYPGLRLGG